MTDEASPAGEAPKLTEEEARAATRTIFRLFMVWDLSEKESREVLGGLTEREFQSLQEGELVPTTGDLAERLGLLLGIHRCLRLLFRSAARRKRWIRAPNRGLGGETALAVMSRSDISGMWNLERYLEAVVQQG
ncbi:MbcA/ParS/Xre antitoxin family protein [Salipiger mucosus]|uniref:Antitoxin Xre/MbcA/ParS-like toxin-binding domain-containing protein n=1 Tax=Salipiger mucosus DSM 16094 TaxID=1123237 RepID=S9REA0_9RHOB|nr:MbcA/ParS/Xre antitoxin family protein [Salipiger mucosus]EPX76455.1 hypothetical protein Salmuc_00341 [Salipiger mucosus DSM 16094]